MKKFLSVILLGLSIILLIACQSEKTKTETSVKKSENSSEEKIKIDESQYDNIIKKYTDVIVNQTQDNSINSLTTIYKDSIVSTTHDLDNNGVNELVIATDSYGSIRIMDLYTINNDNQIVRLTNEENMLSMIGERTTLTPLEDGNFFYHGSGGAATGANAIYHFNKTGDGLEKISEVTYDFSVAEGYKDTETGQVYNEEDYKAKFEASNALDMKSWKWSHLPQNDKQSSETNAGMNADEIVAGNYSSVVGVWKNSDREFVFNETGLANLLDDGHMNAEKLPNGAIRISVTTSTSGYLIYMFPKGVIADDTDASDSTKDRMWMGQNEIFSYPDGFYYKQ